MKHKEGKAANPGPSWGYQTIAFWERWLPAPVFEFMLSIGTWIGLLFMPRQRQYSRQYWQALTGQRPGLLQVYRHFRSFMDSLVLKLRLGRGKVPKLCFDPEAEKEAFIELCNSSQPVLFGTFHVGHSDMMGCMLKDFDRKVAMVRNQVANSRDTEVMAEIFGGNLSFLWINDPGQFIFQLKETIQQGISVGLQCDRTEFSTKRECFRFLGAEREFPMTIYYLADLFKCPVVFSFTGPRRRQDPIAVYTSAIFRPRETRRSSLEAGRAHFQEILDQLEKHLRRYPELWFNFSPLNRPCSKAEVPRA